MTTQPISAHSNEEFYLKTQRYLFQQHDVNSWQTSYFLFYTIKKCRKITKLCFASSTYSQFY